MVLLPSKVVLPPSKIVLPPSKMVLKVRKSWKSTKKCDNRDKKCVNALNWDGATSGDGLGAVLISRSQPKKFAENPKKIAEIYLRYLPLFAYMINRLTDIYKRSMCSKCWTCHTTSVTLDDHLQGGEPCCNQRVRLLSAAPSPTSSTRLRKKWWTLAQLVTSTLVLSLWK